MSGCKWHAPGSNSGSGGLAGPQLNGLAAHPALPPARRSQSMPAALPCPSACRFEPFSAALNKYMRTLGLLS